MAYLSKYQYCRIGYLAKLDWENTIGHRERDLGCFFGIRDAGMSLDVHGWRIHCSTAAPISRQSLRIYCAVTKQKGWHNSVQRMVMSLDVGELLSTGTAPCIVATILCLILENWPNSVAGRFSTRNKLVIGCIDRSSANISFVLNSAPYNCLQISW